MSGIVGIVNLDGVPVDRTILSRMTASLDFRGPDARRIWVQGPDVSDAYVAFGHTLLKTTREATHEKQPFTFDRDTWIIADCRVDQRQKLIAKLRAKDRNVSLELPDVELILHAWHVWGEECVEHILGDFAFAIWDAPNRRLFCARDHLGVKLFYYAHIGSTVVFSNTLDCVRLHPAVSDNLNDQASADFLMFELNQEKDTTWFTDIRKIEPAQTAVWTVRGLQLRRYWTLPIDKPVYFKHLDDYTGRFHELLENAVADRLRNNEVGVFMSGGLDSPGLAATAKRLLISRGSLNGVRAFTTSFDGFDEERHYGTSVAQHLGIPISVRDGISEGIDPNWEETDFHTPEPVTIPFNLVAHFAHLKQVAAFSRTAFWGEGPDNALLYEWQSDIAYRIEHHRFANLTKDMSLSILLQNRFPLFSSIQRRLNRPRAKPRLFPAWINPELESSFNLRKRWVHLTKASPKHPVKPRAYESFQSPLWPALFEDLDAERTFVPLEVRHPFLDLELLGFLISVPPIPWCREKYLLRRAWRQVLPKPVLKRRKTGMQRDPWVYSVLQCGFRPLNPSPDLAKYVDVNQFLTTPREEIDSFWINMRPRCLNYWLQNRNAFRNNFDLKEGYAIESA